MRSARRRASVLAAAVVPVALVLPTTVCGSAPARATASQAAHPPMLKAALEGTYATVARSTSRARVANQPARIVALTFDDGPGRYTPRVLAILKAKGVKATFFVVGGQVRVHPRMTRALARAGMSVQNHTWNHPNLARAGSATILSEIARTDRVIMGQPVCDPPAYVPPAVPTTPPSSALRPGADTGWSTGAEARMTGGGPASATSDRWL